MHRRQRLDVVEELDAPRFFVQIHDRQLVLIAAGRQERGDAVDVAPAHAYEPAPAEAGTGFERRLRGEGRLQRYALEHPDVTLPLELHRDTILGFDCRPVRAGDEVVCMPGNPEGSTRVFADAECTVLATLGGSCEPYPHVLAPSCGGHWSLAAIYRATHPIERAWYLDEASGECVELEDAVALDAHAVEEIPLESLARFTRELR